MTDRNNSFDFRARSTSDGGRLHDLEDFGSNPGNLRARAFVPAHRADRPALVVVLHGCTQTAAGYDAGAGWSGLAEEQGFVLLFPEQRRANNPNLCFNWFLSADNGREAGEALSIRQMIGAMCARHAIDPTRIFITGLSAGGAMTAAMLATYPEVFAGGAIIAGLPYRCAGSIPQALERMRGQGLVDGEQLAGLVRRASDHRGPWPTVSIWHGTADATVHPANAEALLDQWRPLHGVGTQPSLVETVDGHRRRVWHDAAGRAAIEEYRIGGMGHGTPLATRGDDACGAAGPHMLEAGISSTRHIAAAWGLADTRPHRTARPIREAAEAGAPEPVRLPSLRGPRLTRMPGAAPVEGPGPVHAVGTIISDALRAAGLMR